MSLSVRMATPQLRQKPLMAPRFGSSADFASALAQVQAKHPGQPLTQQDVQACLPYLFMGQFAPDVTAALGRLQLKDQTPAMVAQVQKVLEAAEASPLGVCKPNVGLRTLSYDVTSYEDPGKGAAKVNNRAFIDVSQLHGDALDAKIDEYKLNRFGDNANAMVIINPVGFSSIKYQELFANLPELKASVLADASRKGIPPEKALKDAANNLYATAFLKFYGDIFRELKKLGCDLTRFGIVASASDSGVDQAATMLAQRFSMPLAHVTCMKYAQWASSDDSLKKVPILLANSENEYSYACYKMSDALLVNGGRDFALSRDVYNHMLRGFRTDIFPVDLFDSILRAETPSRTVGDNGVVSVNNAARLLKQMGVSSRLNHHAQNRVDSPDLNDEQNAVLNNLLTLYYRKTGIKAPNA